MAVYYVAYQSFTTPSVRLMGIFKGFPGTPEISNILLASGAINKQEIQMQHEYM